MKTLVSGHRLSKLSNYSIDYIKLAIDECVDKIINKYGIIVGMSGMASGVDLWFCEICLAKGMQFQAWIPFPEQSNTMFEEEAKLREKLIKKSSLIKARRNSSMVIWADLGIIVWDGNKGGTHNVFQQMIENKKHFYWINPVTENIILV